VGEPGPTTERPTEKNLLLTVPYVFKLFELFKFLRLFKPFAFLSFLAASIRRLERKQVRFFGGQP